MKRDRAQENIEAIITKKSLNTGKETFFPSPGSAGSNIE